MSYKRLENFNAVLSEKVINIVQLKKLCIDGCLDQVRPLAWKVLLNLLPSKTSDWESHLDLARSHYENYIREFVFQAGLNSAKEDHPLNCDPNSCWVEYFKDNEVLLQINKDCKRLCPDLNFFQQYTKYSIGGLAHEVKGENTLRKRIENPNLKSVSVMPDRMGKNIATNPKFDKHRLLNPSNYVTRNVKEDEEMHWEVVQRILFIYCKTNRAHSYVQGMNEIIGPLYYVFSTDSDENSRKNAEADTFYCFIEIMRDVQPLFIKSLDLDPLCGIQYRLAQFMEYLRDIDLELIQKLEEIKLLPEYYAFRWVTLYMSREFTMPDVIRLWDSLFAVKNRLDFMIYVCCALIIILKEQLMNSNFAQAMSLVQNIQISDINIDEVMRKSLEFYFRYGDC